MFCPYAKGDLHGLHERASHESWAWRPPAQARAIGIHVYVKRLTHVFEVCLVGAPVFRPAHHLEGPELTGLGLHVLETACPSIAYAHEENTCSIWPPPEVEAPMSDIHHARAIELHEPQPFLGLQHHSVISAALTTHTAAPGSHVPPGDGPRHPRAERAYGLLLAFCSGHVGGPAPALFCLFSPWPPRRLPTELAALGAQL